MRTPGQPDRCHHDGGARSYEQVSVHPAGLGYAPPLTNAIQVTPAAVRPVTVTAAKAVARTFNVTEILSISLTRRRDYQRDLRRDFSSSFDSAHQPPIAGSVGVSSHHSWCGRGGQP